MLKIQTACRSRKIVEQKVLDFDLDERNAPSVKIASTELRYIEWLGPFWAAPLDSSRRLCCPFRHMKLTRLTPCTRQDTMSPNGDDEDE